MHGLAVDCHREGFRPRSRTTHRAARKHEHEPSIFVADADGMVPEVDLSAAPAEHHEREPEGTGTETESPSDDIAVSAGPEMEELSASINEYDDIEEGLI